MKNSWMLYVLALGILSCTSQIEEEDDQPFTGLDASVYIEGKKLYRIRCESCHQRDGKGLADLYPPLAESDYFDNNPHNIACIIKHGQETPLKVNGKMYNNPMVANGDLTNREISKIMSYLNNAWGRENGPVSPESVKKDLEKCNR